MSPTLEEVRALSLLFLRPCICAHPPLCLPAGTPTQQHQEELQRAYSQATDLIAQASQAVANLGLSADAEQGFKKALSAFQASEDFLRGWGLSQGSGKEDHHAAAAAHSHDKGATALQGVIQQLQQLLPPGQQHSGCGTTAQHGASTAPEAEIQQSLHCLQHLLTGLEEAAAGQGGSQQAAPAATAPGPNHQHQHQSAGDALKHAWHKLTGKPHELSEAAAQSAQHRLQEAQDAAGTTAHAMHSAAQRTADTASDAAQHATHTASRLPAAAKDTLLEGADQVAATAGFLTETASLSARALADGLLHAGEFSVDAAKQLAGTVTSAEQAAAGAAHDAAQAAQRAGMGAAHSVQDTVQSAKDAASEGLQTAADTAAGAASASSPAAWSGVHHSLQDRLSHVRKTLAAIGKLPSLRPGSLLPSLHHHHDSKSEARSAGGSVTAAAHTDADGLQRARAATIQALHEELEALQVRLLLSAPV
jgi:hypothetical protein